MLCLFILIKHLMDKAVRPAYAKDPAATVLWHAGPDYP